VSPCRSAQADTPADTSQVLESIRKKYRLPALAVVVTRNGKICDRAAVGVRKWGAPTLVTTNDQFHIGSCGKSMTATLAATLIEEGKLRWNTTIGEVFPELKGKMDQRYEKVTLDQLLTHRAGVPERAPILASLEARAEKGTPTQQRYDFIRAVLRKKPQAAPGSKWLYSNQGYIIAGAMLEKLTGTPWETLMTNRLFKPLHMDSAGFGPPGTTGKVNQPWGHTRFLGRTSPSQEEVLPPAFRPAGLVHCCLDDLARYTICHLQGERNDGLLKKETMRKLHTPPAGGDYACGWGCSRKLPSAGTLLTHGGSNGQWLLLMWLAPERNLSVVVATNIAGKGAEKGIVEAARAMMNKWLTE
jgi:CubicO group peptidase (beta-lactamase class C family)